MRNPPKSIRTTSPELVTSPLARVLRRARPRAEALEQRFMFDGAAAVDAVDVATKPLAEATAAQSAAASSAGRTTTDARALPTSVVAAQHQAQQQIQQFLRQPDALDQLVQNFGSDESEANAAWMATARSVVEQIQAGELEPRVELRSGSELQGAKAAFAARGTDGLPTLYLNADWLAGDGQSLGGADSESLVRVLVEELGHYIDTLLNPGSDAAGDEGERFARMVTEGIDPRALSFLAEQDDHAVLTLDGAQIEVEFAQYTFISAYRMVFDLNNNGAIQGNQGETAASKEQSSHNFITTIVGSSVVIDDGNNGAQFSGNDISASALNIESQQIYGWISRPIKSGGIVRGFYFWTDPDFTTLALAQADGNSDGDNDESDNEGYLLVVDQAWFNSQISANSTTVPIFNAIDGNLGNITYATVGSSSDRVDTALNTVVAANTAITVTSPTVNEASPYAVFTVSGAVGQTISLTLGGGTASGAGTDYGSGTATTNLQYSLDGGTTWLNYSTTGAPTLTGTSMLVRTPVVEDAIQDNGETFTLTATPTGGVAVVGTATINDQGGGSIYSANGTVNGAATPTDDRPRPVVALPPPPPARPPALTPIVIPEQPAPPPRPTFDSAVRATQATPLNPITPATIGEIYTSSSGFRTAVIDAPQPALVLFKGVSDQFVERNRPTSFSLPADTFAHTRAEAVVSVEARQSNGTPLPAWMQFNSQAGTFNAQPPAGFTGQVEITVVARDSEGREAAATFKLNVGQGAIQPSAPVDQSAPPQAPTPPPPGRSSLSEQLRAAWQPAKRGFSGWVTNAPLPEGAADAAPDEADLTVSMSDPAPAHAESAGLLARLISH